MARVAHKIPTREREIAVEASRRYKTRTIASFYKISVKTLRKWRHLYGKTKKGLY